MAVTKAEMMERQLRQRGIDDPQVLRAMEEVDRSAFIPEELRSQAYEDRPLPIDGGQTISQPYIVAYMAQVLNLRSGDTILETGAGCGYNAAVLSRIVRYVYTIEIVEKLARIARENLERAGIHNVEVIEGDGFGGLPEHAPFDRIVLTAAPASIPEPLKEQLATGGRLLAPVGDEIQNLVLWEKSEDGKLHERSLLSVRFVPMTGKAQQ